MGEGAGAYIQVYHKVHHHPWTLKKNLEIELEQNKNKSQNNAMETKKQIIEQSRMGKGSCRINFVPHT